MPERSFTFMWLIVSWGLALIFICVSVYDVKRKTPAQFWPWVKVKPENLTDVRAYNCENCSMWMSCAFVFFLIGATGIFSRSFAAVALLVTFVAGSWFTVRRYNKILRRYIKQEKDQPTPITDAAKMVKGD